MKCIKRMEKSMTEEKDEMQALGERRVALMLKGSGLVKREKHSV